MFSCFSRSISFPVVDFFFLGPIFTYAAPLAFVVGLSIAMEGYLDFKRMLRDRDVNHEVYKRLTKSGLVDIKASDIKVRHFIQVETDRRVCEAKYSL